MQDLKAWLNSKQKNYSTGVQLYSKYGKHRSVLTLLQKGETQASFSKLKEVLKESLQEVKQDFEARVTQIQTQTTTTPATEKFKPSDIRGAKDLQHRKLIEEANRLYAEMAVYHARLITCTTNEARLQMALLIMDMQTRWQNAVSTRNYYAAHGKMPRKKRQKRTNKNLPANELRQLMTLRTAYSNYTLHRLPDAKKRLEENPTPKNKTNLERTIASIEKYATRIKELEK